MNGVRGSNLPARIWREVMLATPASGARAVPPVPAAKPEGAEGLEWLMDIIAGVVGGGATN